MDNLITITRLMIALAIPQPEPQPPLTGYLSAYNQLPTDATLQYRIDIGDLPANSLAKYDGFVAVNDCSMIGDEFILSTLSGNFDVVAFDCGGDDGGASWMTKNNIVAEIDWYLWQAHPEIVGNYAELTPLLRD